MTEDRNLSAIEVNFHPNDEGCAIVYFSLPEDNYAILNRTLNPSDQDISLGHAGVHLEVDDQIRSCYDGILQCTLYPSKIHLKLSATGVKSIQLNELNIHYDLPPERANQLEVVLDTIFQNFSNFTKLK